jgi:hypothetical protein
MQCGVESIAHGRIAEIPSATCQMGQRPSDDTIQYRCHLCSCLMHQGTEDYTLNIVFPEFATEELQIKKCPLHQIGCNEKQHKMIRKRQKNNTVL